jgi:BTB/POZ domain-containing protein KCTD9
MTNNPPTIDELRDSFNRVYHGPDRLQREYELAMEAERLGIPLDTYRRLYELRGEEHIDPYPKPKKWWHTPSDWGKWVWYLPPKKKLALSRKGVVKLVQSGVIVTVALARCRYVWEAPKREKLAHYQAWQMINSARGQAGSGGRIDALQDLNKDGVDLQGLDASGANLVDIKLQKAMLTKADLSKSELSYADLSKSNFLFANFDDAYLVNTNLSYARLSSATFSNTTLFSTNLSNAVFDDADLTNADISCLKDYCTNFKGARDITPEQIKKAKNWQSACYDPDFRIKLGLSPQNPKQCVGDEPSK